MNRARPPIAVTVVKTAADMELVRSIRRAVFIEEQQVPEGIEIDGYDAPGEFVRGVVYVLGRIDADPVATGRVVLSSNEPGYGKIGRVAVRERCRNGGYGRHIMDALHQAAQGHGLRGVILGAQVQVVGFYESLGYEIYGEEFVEANIRHRWMRFDF